MTDLLILDLAPELARQLEESACEHGRSLSNEAKSLIRKGLPMQSAVTEVKRGLGTIMMELIRPEDRGDLIFEIHGNLSEPPDFN
jgi:plasmid stability protein